MVESLCTSYCAQSLSHVWFFVTPWTVALQPPLSVRCSRQEYESGLPFPSSEDLPKPGIQSVAPAPFPTLQMSSLLLSLWESKMKVLVTQLCSALWDPQASLSMEFSRQEYWSGYPFPSPEYPPEPEIKARSSTLQADSLLSEPPGKTLFSPSFP